MASNFIDQWKKAGRKINHSGFDISSKKAFSLPAGLQQIPAFFETNPNEFFEVDLQGLLRSETFNTAAFAKMQVVASAFFVPYSQMWHNFNSFVTKKDDRHSSTQKGLVHTPCISLHDLHLNLIKMLHALFIHMFSQGYSYDECSWTEQAVHASLYSYDTGGSDLSDDDYFYFTDLHGYPYIWNFMRALQFYKFGSPYWTYSCYLNSLLEKVNDQGWNYTIDDVWTTDFIGALNIELLDAGYNLAVTRLGLNTSLVDKYVNIWRPAAYQHVFYDIYRSKFFDETPFFQGNGMHDQVRYVDLFNFDDLDCNGLADSIIPCDAPSFEEAYTRNIDMNVTRWLNLFDLHYRQWKHDIYTSAMPAQQFGAVSSVSFDGEVDTTFNNTGEFAILGKDGKLIRASIAYQQYVKDLAGSSDTFYTDPATGIVYSTDPDPATSESFELLTNNNAQKDWALHNLYDYATLKQRLHIPSLFDVMQLRRAECLQQWKMNALRAGNMVDDNFRQHYGVEPFYEGDNNVRLIGSWSIPLDIKPITATASTGSEVNGAVGDLAAIGLGGVKGQKIRFKSNDFGVILFVVSMLPDAMYSANGIDAANTLVEPEDYYSEEFENIGFENLPAYLQSIAGRYSGLNNFGFVPPYTRYKTNVDEVFGEFSSVHDQFANFDGSFRAWTIQRSDSADGYQVGDKVVRPKKVFYVNPDCVDPLFAVRYDGRSITDNFNCFINFDVKALRPMSVLGLPIFS